VILTTNRKHNFNYATNSIPAEEAKDPEDTLPATLAYHNEPGGKPRWWNPAFTFPPIDPANPPAGLDYDDVLPAAYRIMNGGSPPPGPKRATLGGSGITVGGARLRFGNE
jgi:hypothetical protein